MSKLPKLFITYAHDNKADREDLETHLAVMKKQKEIDIWHDYQIIPGEESFEEIFKNLADSDILLYLVSSISLKSENCNKELVKALDAKTTIVSIILEPCDWEHDKQIARFEVLPEKGKPISQWEDKNAAWLDVVKGIRRAISNIQHKKVYSSKKSVAEMEVEISLQRGGFLLMLGHYDAAAKEFDRAIQINPENFIAYINHGVAVSESGDYERAIEDFNRAIELNPKDMNSYNNRGIIRESREDYEEAIKDYDKAINLTPESASVYVNRGNAKVKLGNYEGAIEDYQRAIKLEPTSADIHNNLGNTLSTIDNHEGAIDALDKAIHLNPKHANVYMNRGNAKLRMSDSRGAMEDYEMAIKLEPKNPDGYYSRGNAKIKLDDDKGAIEDYDKAIQLNPNFGDAYNGRGGAKGNLGDNRGAIEDYSKSILLNLSGSEVYDGYGEAEFSRRGTDLMISCHKKLLRSESRYIPYHNRGIIYTQEGKHNLAIEDFNKVIELNPSYSGAYFWRGVNYSDMKEYGLAIGDYNEAIRLDRNNAEAYHYRGIAYECREDYEQAIEDYAKAKDVFPGIFHYYMNEGDMDMNRRNYRRAMWRYNQALRVNEDHFKVYQVKNDIEDIWANMFGEEHKDLLFMLGFYSKACCHRGISSLCLGEWENVRKDLATGQGSFKIDIPKIFHKWYEGISAFEEEHKVKMPADLAALLTQDKDKSK